MSQISMNNVNQVQIIRNDILHLNNQAKLFQTQIYVHIFYSPTVGAPTLVSVDLRRGGKREQSESRRNRCSRLGEQARKRS